MYPIISPFNSADMFVLRSMLVAFLVRFGCVSGQVYRPGGCPDVNYVQYNWTRMHGRWYRVEQYPEYHPEVYSTRCFSQIEIKDSNGTYIIKVSYEDSRTCEYLRDIPVAYVIFDEERPGITKAGGLILPLPDYDYQLLEMDYKDHAILYGCKEVGPDKSWSLEQVFIFSRSPQPMNKCMRERMYNILTKNQINPDFLRPVDQTNCPKSN